MRKIAPLVVLALTAAGLTVGAQSASATASIAGAYIPLAQKRIVDTHGGVGVSKAGAIKAQTFVTASLAGVPSSAAAVQVTITAGSGTASGGITLFKPGSARPGTTNLLFGVNQTVSNTAIAQVLNGQVDIYNAASSGTVQVVLDITGYFIGGTVSGSSGVLHTISPIRAVNTTTNLGATGPVAAGHSIAPILTGAGHALPTQATAAVVTISITSPTQAGSLVAYAGGTAPTEPTVDFAAAGRLSSFAIVPLSASGAVTLLNKSAGTVQITMDVVGYYQSPTPTMAAGTLQALPVARLYSHSVAANSTTSVRVNGVAGVPVNPVLTSAVLLAVQVVSPAASGSMIVYPGGTAPGVRHLTWAAHVSALNLVLVPVSSTGTVSFRTVSTGSATVTVDVYGYVGATNMLPPVTSPGRYVRNIVTGDVTAMHAEGVADAAAGAKLVLLEFGAQKSDKTGVQLTDPAGTSLTYADVQAAVQSYLTGFGAHPGVTVAVGTNNDGPGPENQGWVLFTPTDRGVRWAQLVNAIAAPSGITVVGADDIEPDFWSTEVQAKYWETGYLAATAKQLIFNGSTDGCPQTLGSTAACNHGWTPAQIYAMAHNGARIKALPQVYFQSQANQWANIDYVGGKAITFAGALTEFGTASSTFTPAAGFAALYHAISGVVSAPSIPALVDIHVDS